MPLPHNFQLKSIKVFSQRNQLANGQTINTIAPKVMQTLIVLARHAPETVSREQLFNEVWGDVVVSDEALSRVISDLRQALGDSHQKPQFVETVKKVGYRLIVQPQATTSENHKKNVFPIIGFSLLAACFALLAIWYTSKTETISEHYNAGFKRLPMTASDGIDGDPRFSKDGRLLVYKSIGQDGNTDIFLKNVSQQTTTRLTHTAQSEISPVFSPDSKYIAFIRSPLKQCRIMVLNLETRVEHELKPCFKGNWRSLDWSVDGKTLATDHLDLNSNRRMVELFSFPEGETLQFIKALEQDSGTGHPRFSPDGKKLLFIEGSVVAGSESLQMVELTTGKREKLVHQHDFIFGFSWLAQSDAFVFISSGSTNTGIWLRNVNEDVSQLLHSGSVEDIDVNWHNGDIIVTEAKRDSNIWSLKLTTKVVEDNNELAQPTLVVKTTAKDYFPSIAPNGSHLAYVSERSGARELWLKNLHNGSEQQLTDFAGGLIYHPQWDSDSDEIIFTRIDEISSTLYSVNIHDRRVMPIKTGDETTRFGLWHKQNSELIWSARQGNAWSLKVGDTNQQGSQIVLTKDIYNPMKVAGENALYYSDNICNCVQKINLSTFKETTTSLLTWDVFPYSWFITEDFFYRYEAAEKWTENQLVQINRHTGEKRKLASFERFLAYDYPTLSFHKPTDTLYYTTVDEIQTDLWLYQVNN
ncbi:winged helix-turn-helix domain-containing protein [Thalassotalea fusca]